MASVANALTIEHDETKQIAPVRETLPASPTAAILQMIADASRDPNVDLDKMKGLMAMRKEILRDEAEQAFNAAMKAAQAEMRSISADAENKQTHSRYATYAKLDNAIRPIYTKHGFSVSFDEDDSPKDDHIRVLAYVAHEAGFTRTYRKDMPADGKGAKGGDVMTKTHATGAAASYGMRYLLKGIFNVAVGEDDTDGNAPQDNGGPISSEQRMELQATINDCGVDIDIFCEKWKIESLADFPASKLNEAVSSLKRWKAQQGGRSNG